ncbi:MAG: hypothetical protein H6Q76_1502, partial [Firmicutes bacterium]|nr:hypothetical protein [Bacillota bacterium]
MGVNAGNFLGSTHVADTGRAWGAEVAEFCRSVQDCAGCKSFKINRLNTWPKTGSQEAASSTLVSSTNKSHKSNHL